MSTRRILASVVASVLLLVGLSSASAQEQDGQKQARELQAAVDAMQKVLQPGPSKVSLANQATFSIPAGANFVRQPEAGTWAIASGYGRDDDLIGVVVPTAEESWITFIDYHPQVRVVDDEASAWNTDTLLANLKASTEQGNADRQKRGEPQLEVRNWLEKPAYDASGHRLIWAAVSPEKGGDADEGSGNVHAYVLGRDGYFELTMVSPANEIAGHLSVAKTVLAGIRFGIGRRYEDYAASRDIREQPITALISPGAAGVGAQALGYLKSNWVWLALGLALLALVAGGILRVARR